MFKEEKFSPFAVLGFRVAMKMSFRYYFLTFFLSGLLNDLSFRVWPTSFLGDFLDFFGIVATAASSSRVGFLVKKDLSPAFMAWSSDSVWNSTDLAFDPRQYSWQIGRVSCGEV